MYEYLRALKERLVSRNSTYDCTLRTYTHATRQRQNPITASWNSEEHLWRWQAMWADASNRYKPIPKENGKTFLYLFQHLAGHINLCRDEKLLPICL